MGAHSIHKLVLSLSPLAMLLLAAPPAFAGAPGSMIITASPVDTSQSDFEKAAKQAQVKTIDKSGDEWSFSFLAWLKRADPAPEINVAFYDVAEKGHELVNAVAVSVPPRAKVMTSTVSIGPEQGFKPGHTYSVLLTRVKDGKENVFAQSKLTLR